MVAQPFDILGPLPVMEEGKQYTLLTVDHATCFQVGYALCSITAVKVARTITEFVNLFGWTKVLVIDRDSNTFFSPMEKLCEVAEMKHLPILAYHQPASQCSSREDDLDPRKDVESLHTGSLQGMGCGSPLSLVCLQGCPTGSLYAFIIALVIDSIFCLTMLTLSYS